MQRTTSWKTLLPLFAVLALMVSGQILSKWGALRSDIGHGKFNPVLFLSYGLFLVRGVLWAIVLRRTPLYIAYPLSSLSYPLILLADLIFFGASLDMGKLAGTLLVATGSVLILLPENKSEAER